MGSDARIINSNRAALEMLGHDARNLLGRPVIELYADPPAGKERAQELFQRFIAGQEINDQELQMQTADGRLIWVSLSVRTIFDDDGQVLESRSTLLDITSQVQAEEKLLYDAPTMA